MGNVDKEISNLNIFDNSSINLYGRSKVIDYNNKKQVFFGFTATGFELICEPTSEQNEIKATLLSESEGHEHQYIKTYIDGKEKEVIELHKGEQEITLFKNLELRLVQKPFSVSYELAFTKLEEGGASKECFASYQLALLLLSQLCMFDKEYLLLP